MSRTWSGLQHSWFAFVGLGVAVAGGAVVAVMGPQAQLGLLAGAGLLLLVLWRARQILLVGATTTLLLGSSLFLDTGRLVFYGRFAMLAAVALGTWRLRSGTTLRRSRLVLLLGGLSLFALLSTLWSESPGISLQRSAAFALMVLAVLGIASRWRSRNDIRTDVSLIVLVLGVAIFVSLAGFLVGAHWSVSQHRLRGLLENPNTIGVVAALCIPLGIGLAGSEDGRTKRLVWLAVVGASAVALFASQSRGGVLGAVGGLLAIGYRHRGGKRHYWLVPVALVLVVAVVSTLGAPASGVPAVDETVARLRSLDSSGRTQAWSVVLGAWQQRPLLGWGFGTLDQVFPVFGASITNVFNGATAHDVYLQVLFELGPTGLALLLAAIVAVLWKSWQPTHDFFEAAVFGAFVAGALNQLVESGISSPGSIIAFNFWLLGVAVWTLRALSVPVGEVDAIDSLRTSPGRSLPVEVR